MNTTKEHTPCPEGTTEGNAQQTSTHDKLLWLNGRLQNSRVYSRVVMSGVWHQKGTGASIPIRVKLWATVWPDCSSSKASEQHGGGLRGALQGKAQAQHYWIQLHFAFMIRATEQATGWLSAIIFIRMIFCFLAWIERSACPGSFRVVFLFTEKNPRTITSFPCASIKLGPRDLVRPQGSCQWQQFSWNFPAMTFIATLAPIPLSNNQNIHEWFLNGDEKEKEMKMFRIHRNKFQKPSLYTVLTQFHGLLI